MSGAEAVCILFSDVAMDIQTRGELRYCRRCAVDYNRDVSEQRKSVYFISDDVMGPLDP